MNDRLPSGAAEPDHGQGPFRTWDGHPVSQEPPHGAMIVVYRCRGGAAEFLLLHRRHHGPDYMGDWAWGPPSGARYPGEAIERCAARELEEETQLRLTPRSVAGRSAEWPVFVAEVPPETAISLSPEHDRFVWLSLPEAAALVAPATVRESFLAVAQGLASCK